MQVSEVKVGDHVRISGCYAQPRIGVVTKVTATQVVVGNQRFSKKTGRVYGGSQWSRLYADYITPEAVAEFKQQVEKDNRKSWLKSQFSRHLNWDNYDLDKLEQVAAILGIK